MARMGVSMLFLIVAFAVPATAQSYAIPQGASSAVAAGLL